MMPSPHERLSALNIVLPAPVAPVANYVPFVRVGHSVFVSGQVSVDAAGGVREILGEDLDLAAGQAAARLCAVNLLAQFNAACGGISNASSAWSS